MKSKDYEYGYPNDDYNIPEKRKNEMIKKVKNQIRKGFIAHYQILKIGSNDEEWDFLYDWLNRHEIEIRGINGTISGEIPNYLHIPKMGQSLMPEVLEYEEHKTSDNGRKKKTDYDKQNELFLQLQEFSEEDRRNNVPAYRKIRDRIIEQNMRLAKWVTTWKGIQRINLPQEDKQQMAYMALIRVVDRFNPNLGYKFSTYACKSIYSRIIIESYKLNDITKQNMVINEQLAMLPEIRDQILVNLGREAKTEEIADILGVSVKRVEELERIIRLQKKESIEQINAKQSDIETITSALRDGETVVSADDDHYIMDGVYVDEEDILPLGFSVEDRTEEETMIKHLQGELRKVLTTLTPREERVLKMKFGLDDGKPKSSEKIARHFNVTRVRIHQIEAKALRKLRHPSRFKKIKDFRGVESRDEDYRIL